jgi:hypothetical protein
MTDFSAIHNPIWSSLTTVHAPLARGTGLARRFPSDMSPLSGLADSSPKAFADMAPLVAPDESVALFTLAPLALPDDWQVVRTRYIDQMICHELIASPSIPLLPLGPGDVPDMLALTAATEPGPFRPRTIEMGRYFGIRHADGRLIAMAGERLRLTSFTEISAVCTHPEFRGQGLGRALVSFLAAKIFAEGKTPILHLNPENPAKFLYQKVGFTFRSPICLTLIAHARSAGQQGGP